MIISEERTHSFDPLDMGYYVLSLTDRVNNRDMLFNFGGLNNNIGSELFVDAPKKKDGSLRTVPCDRQFCR